MLKDGLWRWIMTFEVVCRPTCTYLVRPPERIAAKLRRDQGVEYHLTRWHGQGKLSKRAVGLYVAYYLPTGRPGVRGNLAHDLLAGLAAAKLYADLKGRAGVQLQREPCGDRLPDWTLHAQLRDPFRYLLEYHSARNPERMLAATLAGYEGLLQENDFVLVVSEAGGFVSLPSDRFLHVALHDLLAVGDCWQSPIWQWGVRRGRHSLLES